MLNAEQEQRELYAIWQAVFEFAVFVRRWKETMPHRLASAWFCLLTCGFPRSPDDYVQQSFLSQR
jgi:hypothetical protein